MTEYTESNILADVFEDVRGLTRFYLSKTANVDAERSYEVAGKQLNSLYWLMGHLTWSEHFLLIEAMTGEKLDIPWLEKFEIGSDPAELMAWEDRPSLEEIRSAMEVVHEKAMATVRSLSSEQLDEANLADLSFRAGNTRRIIVRHAIRHEPMHTGQISWICKINEIETF